jgi:hypothetical protein
VFARRIGLIISQTAIADWRNIPITLTDPVPNCSAVEFPNACPKKDQSRKSERVTGHALFKLRIADSTP